MSAPAAATRPGPSRLIPSAFRTVLAAAVLRDAPRFAYVLRTGGAVALALWCAFFLQLSAPMSSVTTVLIVANPSSGALISKSLWRLFGTVLGAAGAVVLMAGLAQTPLLFFAALAVCIGLACFVASLLRFFRAYAAILAGYTVIIVASGAFADPDRVFASALSRVSAVGVGLLSTALVFLLTTGNQAAPLARTLLSVLGDVSASVLARRGGGDGVADPDALPPPPPALRRPALLPRIEALDELVEYAVADSWDIRRRGTALRTAASRLLGLLDDLDRPRTEPDTAARTVLSAARAATTDAVSLLVSASRAAAAPTGTIRSPPVPPAPGPPGLDAAIAALRAAAQRLRKHEAVLVDPAALVAIRHERRLLDGLADAATGFTARGSRRRQRPPVFLDWTTAMRNGSRGAVLTFAAALFWYLTRWTAGPTLLNYLVPAACIVSTTPSAGFTSVRLATGTLLAIPAAMLFQILVLPRIDGFPLLALCLFLFLAPGIWLQLHPTLRLQAFGYSVFFNAMVRVTNPNTFDDPALLNGWLAFALGAGALPLVFRVLLPPVPVREAERLMRSLCRALERAARVPLRSSRRPTPVDRSPVDWRWQHRQLLRVLRLLQRLSQCSNVPATAVEREAFAAVALAHDLAVLGALAVSESPGTAAEPARAALRELSRLGRDPANTARRLREQAAALSGRPDPAATPGPTPDRLLIGTLGQAAALLDGASRLLHRRTGLGDPAWHRTDPAAAAAVPGAR